MAEKDWHKYLKSFFKIASPFSENSSKEIDWGVISAFSILEIKTEVLVDSPALISSTVDAVSFEPRELPNAGKFQVTVRLDIKNLVPGALIEGELIITSANETKSIRLFGEVDSDILIENITEVICHHPWKLIKMLSGHKGKIWSISFLPGSDILVSGSNDRSVRWWDINASEEYQTPINFDCEVRSVAVSQDGQRIAVGLANGTISIHNIKDQQIIWSNNHHKGMISDLTFSPDSRHLAAGSGDRTISVWDVKTGKMIYEPVIAPEKNNRKPGIVTSVAVSGNGLLMASASQTREISLWELKSGRYLRELVGHQGNVWSIDFSLDGHNLVSGSYDKTVRLWDTQSCNIVRVFEGFTKDIYCVSVSPDGNLLATASGEPKIRIWECQTGRRLANLESGNIPIWKLQFSTNQKFLAGGCQDGTIYVWAVGSHP